METPHAPHPSPPSVPAFASLFTCGALSFLSATDKLRARVAHGGDGELGSLPTACGSERRAPTRSGGGVEHHLTRGLRRRTADGDLRTLRAPCGCASPHARLAAANGELRTPRAGPRQRLRAISGPALSVQSLGVVGPICMEPRGGRAQLVGRTRAAGRGAGPWPVVRRQSHGRRR